MIGTSIGNSLIWDNGTNVGIGNTNTSYTLDVSGTGRFTGALTSGGEILSSGGQLALSGSGGAPSTGVGIRYNGTFYVYAGANGFNIRNNANSANNLVVADNGYATLTGYLGVNGASASTPLLVKVDTNLQFRVDTYLSTTNLASINGTASAYAGMKIDGTTIEINSQSGGDVYIGPNVTNQGFNLNLNSGTGGTFSIGHPAGAGTGFSYVLFYYNFGAIGSVGQSGTTAVVYNTTSDYRLKENVSTIQNAVQTILKIKPVSYKWKNVDEYGEGFLAHELQEIVPLAVTGEKDDINEDGTYKLQQVDYSKLVPHLVKAIQEQQAQIQNLQEQINILAK